MTTDKSNTLIGGRYRLEERLGEGGMGEVFRARDCTFERRVAIKTLHGHLTRQQDLSARFKQEARIQAILVHPGIVRVTDLVLEDGVIAMVMDYVDGPDLSDYLDEVGGRLSLARAWEVLCPVMEALEFAHNQGVVHRDLKPSNIMLDRSGGLEVPKIVDFGIAKLVDVEQGMTRTGALMGTPQFMSPEQLKSSKHIDHRTDIYALGVMLYQLLTGVLPYDGDSHYTITYKVLAQEPVPSASELVPGLTAAVDEVIERAKAFEANARYSSVAEFREALGGLLRRQTAQTMEQPQPEPDTRPPRKPTVSESISPSTTPPESTPSRSPLTPPPGPPVPDTGGAPKGASRSRIAWAVGLVGFGVVGLIGAYLGASVDWSDNGSGLSAALTGTKSAERSSRGKKRGSNKKRAEKKQADKPSPTKRVQPKVAREVERYRVLECGGVLDTKTNLTWLVGPNKPLGWGEALRWVRLADACGGGWRMPSLGELKSLHRPGFEAGQGAPGRGRRQRAKIHPVFEGIGGGNQAWSDKVDYKHRAWALDLHSGGEVRHPRRGAGATIRTFAVRASCTKNAQCTAANHVCRAGACLPREGAEVRIPIDRVVASSFIPKHPPHYAVDGTHLTAWNEHVEGPGDGEWLELRFQGRWRVTKIEMATGYAAYSEEGADTFPKNAHLKAFRITAGGGDVVASRKHVPPTTRHLLLDDLDVTTDRVRLWADRVYPGTKWQDLCISEVVVYGVPEL